MLAQIKQFFDKQINFQYQQEASESNVQIACAALLIEMMHIDDKIDKEEQNSVIRRLKAIFTLTPEQIDKIMALAAEQREQSTDYFQFTHLINKQFPAEKKVLLIESLWQVAYSDGTLNDYEEYLVRKIADLLHVPHRDFILARNRVRDNRHAKKS